MNFCYSSKTGKLLSYLVLAITLAIFTTEYSSAQCVSPPVQPTCSGGPVLVDNETITTGNTRIVTGTSSFSNLTINGGTLIVCGTLNLANFTFTSGTIYVLPSGTLNVNTGAAVVFGSNCNLYNYGTVYFASSIVTGANNLIMNCLISSVFNITFNQFVLQGMNTQFVNYGTFNSSYFIVQSTNSPNPVCSGPGSVIVTGTMINQYGNAFTSPSGPSCIQIYTQVINSQPMTLSSSVNICYFGSSSAGLNFGNATVTLNCNTCSIPLPVDQIQLQGLCTDAQLQLQWIVQSEEDCSLYSVELSEDGYNFQNVREVQCQGASTNPLVYSCEMEIPPLWHYYARIKRSDVNGNETFSLPIALNCLLGSTIDIFPTYVTDDQITITSDDRIVAINMYGMDGRIVKRFPIQPDQKIAILEIDQSIALGEYLLTVETPVTRVDRLIHIAH